MAYDHGAFRVSSLESSIEFYTKKLGFTFLFQNDNPAHHEKYAFLEYNGARLELIETTDEVYVPSAPMASKPLMCWSMGRGPKLQPPGSATLAWRKRPSCAPMR